MSDPKKEDESKAEEKTPTDPITEEIEEPLGPESPTGNYRIAQDVLQELIDGKRTASTAAKRLITRLTPSPKKPKSA